jgi:hypothetical protein
MEASQIVQRLVGRFQIGERARRFSVALAFGKVGTTGIRKLVKSFELLVSASYYALQLLGLGVKVRMKALQTARQFQGGAGDG